MSSANPSFREIARQADFWLRGLMFCALWLLLLPSFKCDDLLIGLGFALGASLSSMILLPPALAQLRVLPLVLYLPRFVWQSFIAGWDIARRAFDPKMPLAPGFVVYPTQLEPGTRRNAFMTFTSLTPGTLPCGASDALIVYHVVDTQKDYRAQLHDEERYLTHALAKTPQP